MTLHGVFNLRLRLSAPALPLWRDGKEDPRYGSRSLAQGGPSPAEPLPGDVPGAPAAPSRWMKLRDAVTHALTRHGSSQSCKLVCDYHADKSSRKARIRFPCGGQEEPG